MDEVIKEQAREIMSGMFRKPIHEGVNAIASAIAGERKRCAEAVLAEKLAGETNDPTDISYNVAIEHAHDAIWRTA